MATRIDTLLGRLADVDDALAAALSPALADDDPRSMTDAEILAFARRVEAIGRRVDAARLIVASEVDDRSRPDRGAARLSATAGCGSTVELLTRVTGVSTSTARMRIRSARAVASSSALSGETVPPMFPRLREALDGGLVGIDTLTAIATTLAPLSERCHPADLAAAEQGLVADAVGSADAPALDADSTLLQARVWALALDPDGVLPEYERAMRRRGLRLGRIRDGLVPISGGLLPDVAAQFERIVHAHLNPRVEDRATDPHRGPVFVETTVHEDRRADDARTRAQKVHDVFASAIGVAARAAETPTLGGASAALLVTISAGDLPRPDGIAVIDGTDQALPSFVARHIACSGGIQRVTIDDTGRILELGSPQRVFTAHQRRAIAARDGGCVIPGCHVPAACCEIHHATPHARGGPTHTDNGVMLCWHHHRTLDTSGWAVRMTAGIPEVRAPAHLDPGRPWRAAGGSAHLQRQRRREQDRRRRWAG